MTSSKVNAACEACRRRKTKCDRSQPQCGACYSAHTPCLLVDERPRRGPKKGELRALKAQVAMLEKQLFKRDANVSPYDKTLEPGSIEPPPALQSLHGLAVPERLENVPIDIWNVDLLTREPAVTTPNMTRSMPITPSPAGTFPITLEQWESFDSLNDMIRADLDALYYLRVHPCIPIIHQWRYLSWARQKSPGTARSALRLAMWTIATAFSAQYRALGTSLYHQAQNLANATGPDTELTWEAITVIPLEQIQAQLLLAHYELMCVNHSAAMVTATQVYRLVQASGLHNIDVATSQMCDEEALVVTDEKRRTFWLAFCFDRLVTSQDNLHMTLEEEMLHVNFPSSHPDLDTRCDACGRRFQEAVSQSTPGFLCPLSEMIVLIILYGRCVMHWRLAATGFCHTTNNSPPGVASFWKRHEWLAARLQQRTQPMPTTLTQLEYTLEKGPLALLAHFLVRSAAIHLSDTLWCLGVSDEAASHGTTILECRRRALHAAIEMAGLARTITSLGRFRVHPYLPNLLAHAAAFISRNKADPELSLTDSRAEEDLLESIRQFQDGDVSVGPLVRTMG